MFSFIGLITFYIFTDVIYFIMIFLIEENTHLSKFYFFVILSATLSALLKSKHFIFKTEIEHFNSYNLE